MNVEELEARLQGVGKWEERSIPTAVAERIEQTLAALPERSVGRRTAVNRRKALAALLTSAVVISGAIVSYAPERSAKNTEKNAHVQTEPSVEVGLPGDRSTQSSENLSSVRDDVQRMMTLLYGANWRVKTTNFRAAASIESGVGVTNRGITVKLGQIAYDGYGLAIRYSVTSEQPLDNFALRAEVRIDGEPIGFVGEREDGTYGLFQNEYRLVAANRYEGILTIPYYPHEGFRMQHAELEINISQISSTKGEWQLATDVSSYVPLTLNYQMEPPAGLSSYGKLEIVKASVSPASLQIEYKLSEDGLKPYQVLGFSVEDDKGNRYGEITWHEKPKDGSLMRASLPAVAANATSLIVRPYVMDQRKFVGKKATAALDRQPSDEQPIVLPIGDAGQLLITDIEYQSDRTVVYAKTDDDRSFTSFSLSDAEGSQIPFIDWVRGTDSGMIFAPVRPGTPLIVEASEQPRQIDIPEMEIRIDLP